MSQPPNLSQQDQQEVARFQNIQQQLEFMMQQQSSIQHQFAEKEAAIKELESAEEDAIVYKSAGGIFIKSSVPVLLTSSKEKKEELEIRLNSITKQVERINKQYEEQKAKIQEINKKLGY
ncbi:prefoldin subunit beta [Promethearchaeum syntrophicum]|uniref:Prefoldin subunit beta n=1 Tax=Promethearchaeum syntrophicum TaxID=2594042 RepID=A0A5B9D5X0_9ARCH|nr:prefoldin subunit beta [Candidatus Prometheoarchaeum syntrophicum]QEE14462.1 Prefoldin subunit beta [Candidatus Prometheoarchaeum syntrophicum]